MTSVAAAPAFARMAAIQARFTPPSTAPTTTGSAADFASLLHAVTRVKEAMAAMTRREITSIF